MTELEMTVYWNGVLDECEPPLNREGGNGVRVVSLEAEMERWERQMNAQDAIIESDDWTPTTAMATTGLRRYAAGRARSYEDEMASYERAMDDALDDRALDAILLPFLAPAIPAENEDSAIPAEMIAAIGAAAD